MRCNDALALTPRRVALTIAKVLGDRLMVGRGALDPVVEVQILLSQPLELAPPGGPIV